MTTLDLSHRLDDIVGGNAAFASANHVGDLALMPRLKTIVLGCADPRVDPTTVLGLRLGDAAVIRNIGGRVNSTALRTLAMLALIARSNDVQPGDGWQLVVLHHTDCGIRDLTAHPEALAFELDTTVDELDLDAIDDPRRSLAVDLAALHANPMLPRGLIVSGLLYDTSSGRVEIVVPPSALGEAA